MAEKTKMISTTLDSLPFGRESDWPEPGSKLTHLPLPSGVTSGMIYKDIIRIAWPSFIELVLTQLTSMADQIMVGRLTGQSGVFGLAAVGLCTQPKFLLMTMMQALNVGATAMVARFRGQGNQEKANLVFRQTLLFNILLSSIFCILGLIFCNPMLRFMGGEGISPQTYVYAEQYFRIQMYGFVPLSMTFTVTAVLRGVGDTKMPLIYNTLANVVNVIFNYLLIYGKFGFPKMEVVGASLATVLGQTCAFIFAYIFMFRKQRYIYLDLREKFHFDWTILQNVVSIGIPSMIEQLIMRAGIIIYTKTVTSLGDISYATHQICMNIQAMSFMTGQAFANSATTLMGQSLGKKRLDMAENYTRYTRRVGLYASIVLAAALIIFSHQIVGLYNNTPDIIQLGGSILTMVALIQPFQSNQFIVTGALRGAGDTRFPAISVFVSVLVVRTSLALLLINVFHLGLWGAWYAMVADQIMRTTLIFLHYNTGKWRFLKLKGQNEPVKEG